MSTTQQTMKTSQAASYDINEEEYAAFVTETSASAGSSACSPSTLRKIYRAATYDEYDEKYATHLKIHKIPDAFNTFTNGLMNEKYINRFSLLKAIDDYNKTEKSREFPLELAFENAAFNYRPYQPCIIS